MQANDHITLAVFRFEDLSREKAVGIFCRAFSTDLITELSRFRQFRVISSPANGREGEFSSAKSVESDTDYFIQGTFRCDKEMVRVNVQLYKTSTRHMIWGDRLQGNLTGLAEIQNDLLTGVVGALQHQINHDLLSAIRKRAKVEFKAYEHWLHGMEEIKSGSVENDLVARDHFQKALQIQPDYSLAYAGMSLTYFNEWSCQLWDRWEVSKTGAYEWAQKAIELDDQNYIAAMVLGKIFLYEGSYDTAEYFFRKSLLLNSNDPDTLIQIALCFVFLGSEKEALQLYEKTVQLNPLNADKYFIYGVCIYFEIGEYEKAGSLAMQIRDARMANADAYYAAIYFYLQQHDKMQKHWNLFLSKYDKLISKGKNFTSQEVVDWIMKTNPFRHKTNLEAFLRHISNGSAERKPPPQIREKRDPLGDNYFTKEAVTWKISFEGGLVQVPELKGFYDIQKMLLEPFHLFHCAELMGTTIDASGQKLIDEKARKQYQKRILELQNDIQEAEQRSNFPKIEELQHEYDALIKHLSKSLGLKGKSREAGSSVEKARSAVAWRIRHAISRVEQYYPPLGAHLSNAIKTGLVCSYQPDREITWANR